MYTPQNTNCKFIFLARHWTFQHKAQAELQKYFPFWELGKWGKNCLRDESIVYNNLYRIYNRSAALSVENSEIDTPISKRLSVVNKVKLSQMETQNTCWSTAVVLNGVHLDPKGGI